MNNRSNHSLSSKNTMGTSCNPANKTITSCSSCDYYTESKANIPHQLLYLVRNVKDVDGEIDTVNGKCIYFIEMQCKVCYSGYNRTIDGAVYKYADGSIVDPATVASNEYLVCPDGARLTFGYYVAGQVTDNIVDNESYRVENNTVYYSGAIDVPRSFVNGSMDRFLWAVDIHRDYPYANKSLNIASNSYYNSSDSKFYFDISFPIRNSNGNYESAGRFCVCIQWVNGSTTYKAGGHSIYVNTNFADPIVNGVEFSS